MLIWITTQSPAAYVSDPFQVQVAKEAFGGTLELHNVVTVPASSNDHVTVKLEDELYARIPNVPLVTVPAATNSWAFGF
jgi:hypothetical protein